jgi:hypothetical protein
MKYNVEEIPYLKYIETMSLIDGGNTNITNQLLTQLFKTHPEFDRIKETLILSTFRTSLITDTGLNGETQFHIDEYFFPREKDSNLIITWGVGTESATIDLSQLVQRVRQKIIETKYTNWNNLIRFTDNIFAYPLNTIEPYKLIDASTEKDQFKKIVKETYDTLIEGGKKLNLDILSSSSPNASGNITALIMSGKEVYHRRKPPPAIPKIKEKEKEKEKEKAVYRYALNIYFNAADLQPMKTPGGKKKRGTTQKKRTNRRHRKTR